MTTSAAIALILGIISSAPEIIGDVEKLIASLKSGDQPLVPISPEVHAALDGIHARIMAAALADRAKG